MSVFLPAAVGVRMAKQMSLTGNFVDAHRALELGLVNEVVPHDGLVARATALGHDISGNDQRAVRNLKRLYDDNQKLSGADAIANEQRLFRTWQVDPAEVERRREAVVARGRNQ
jgi:enoyl-CoA hydratase